MRKTTGEITSRDNERVKYTAKLMQKPAFCRAENRFVAEGVKLCLDAAGSGLAMETVYYTYKAEKRWPQLLELPCEQLRISEPVAEKLSGQKTPQGVFAVCRMPEFGLAEADPAGRYIALEDVQDPANVGAVLRSAAAFGFSGAILTPGCADPFGQKVLRASMGAVFKLPVFETADLAGELRRLGAQGAQTLAAALRGAQDLREIRRSGGGLALAVGNEGNGLSAEVIAACSAVVRIPIRAMESLNAAVAASVLMWELGGRRDG
ncbi:RNA methyltransferase [Anaerofilum hominis]